MNDLLSDDIVAKLIGVIDLRHGHAVHAIAGDRDRYQKVDICDGDPVVLAKHYRELGVTDLYVADLDAIIDGRAQVEAIKSVCRSAGSRILIDLGCCDAIATLASRHPDVCWIAATESLGTVGNLAEVAEMVTPQRLFLGLDYRGGKLISAIEESEWVQTASQLGICGVVVLDLLNVGTGSGPTTIEICRRVTHRSAKLSVISGGGIRSAQDVCELLDVGCDRCLVATALQS